MTVSVQFTDRTTEFTAKVAVFTDTLMGLMAAGIENKMKTGGEIPYLPHKKNKIVNHRDGTKSRVAVSGALRASIRHVKLEVGKYAITVGENSPAGAYAAAQEAGMTRGHQITNYSTAGTGPHFFQHAIDNVNDRRPDYIMAAQRAAGLENL